MIKKEDLKDWLDESGRKEYAKELEEFIDGCIKANAIQGNLTFYIPTGKYTTQGSRKTAFFELWYTNKLSEQNRTIVHNDVLQRYKDFGFDVEKTSVDGGWHNHYLALKFSNIDNILEG